MARLLFLQGYHLRWRRCILNTFQAQWWTQDGRDILLLRKHWFNPRRSSIWANLLLQYEIDDGTEVHNNRLPSTTACPYLPGQPVNLLFVPIEKATARQRSASVGAPADLKTMNPADKFLTPRPAPPTPQSSPRLSTSAGLLGRKRGSRSTSPTRSSWSIKNLFGVRSSSPSTERPISRGRHLDVSISRPTLVSSSSNVHTATIPLREFSPLSSCASSIHSRDASPVRPTTSLGHRPALLSPRISEEIVEERDDDFAVMDEEATITTYLSPPPSQLSLELPSFSPLPALQIEEKPLPNLPRFALQRPQPKSHFSADTISTTLLSPVDSHFDFSPATSECNDEADEEMFFNPITESPAQENTERPFTSSTFRGYGLPFDSDEDRKTSGGKMTPMAFTMPNIMGSHNNSQETFGFQHTEEADAVIPSSNLDQLLSEMGYLGEMIEQ